MKVCILTTSDLLYQKISLFYASPDWETSRYVGQIPDAGILILVEPLLAEGEFYGVSDIWRAHTEKSASKLLVLSASYFPCLSADIDLLSLPDQLDESLLAKALPNRKYYKRISDKLAVLLDGHGKDSLLKRVTQLKSALDVVRFLHSDGHTLEEAFGQVWGNEVREIAAELPTRWKQMECISVLTPYFLNMEIDLVFPIEQENELNGMLGNLETMSLYLRSLKKAVFI